MNTIIRRILSQFSCMLQNEETWMEGFGSSPEDSIIQASAMFFILMLVVIVGNWEMVLSQSVGAP